MGRFPTKFPALFCALAALYPCGARPQEKFANPIIEHGADPSVILVGGAYYSVSSGCPRPGGTPAICIRSSATLPGLREAAPVAVWTAPAFGPNATNVWAPQIEFLGGPRCG